MLLGGAGLLAGAVNAVAGGGSLISFPALLAVGYPSVPANVTNNVALLPGYVGGTLAYRERAVRPGPARAQARRDRRGRRRWSARCCSTSARRACSRRSCRS